MRCPECGAVNAPSMTTCGNCGQSLAETFLPTSKRTGRSNAIEDLLSKSILREESALKERLRGAEGFLARSLVLPMTVVFRSEVETVSFHVDKQGNMSIGKGALPNPTLVLEGSQPTICEMLLRSREPRLPAPGSLRFTLNMGPVRGMKVEIADGQIIEHPLRSLLGYVPATYQAKEPSRTVDFPTHSPAFSVSRRQLVSLMVVWASFATFTVLVYLRGFEGTRILSADNFVWGLAITLGLSVLLLVLLGSQVALRKRKPA